MRRRQFRKPSVNVSLFPFLAVLVCTMGSLIVLLVLMVQQARVYATVVSDRQAAADEAKQETLDELELQRNDFEWRGDILATQRVELTSQLADRRLRLGHLEDHIRRLEQKWKQLEAEAVELASLGRTSHIDAEAAESELNQLKAALDEARATLADAQAEAAERPRSFAIVPYDGPNGTRRRPIFIECTERGIILQPEGIVLRPSDFEGPMGPGNPLDAALRTIRAYLSRHGGIDDSGEPYPLLVVRPNGTVAYNEARNAMKAWDDEFGYELIDDELQLEYPETDPALKQEIRRAVADARQRQQILAVAMPSQYSGGPGQGLVASSGRGGFVTTGTGGRQSRGYGGEASGSGAGDGPGGSQDGFDSDEFFTAPPYGETEGSQGADHAPPGAGQRGDVAGGTPGGNGGPNANGSADGASISRSRGKNWALPKATAHSTGITRPIRVVVWPDRLIILPDDGDHARAKPVLIRNGVRAAVDEFVTEVWKHMDRWGLAVAGGYWKPVLSADVAPNAEPVFADLERLLQGSGIDVKRKTR